MSLFTDHLDLNAIGGEDFDLPTHCHECGGDAHESEWFMHLTGPPQLHTPARYTLNQVQVQLILGCGACGETLLILDMHDIVNALNEDWRAS